MPQDAARNRIFNHALQRKQLERERQISALRSYFETEALELRQIDDLVGNRARVLTTERAAFAHLRQAGAKVATVGHRRRRGVKTR